MEKTRIQLVNRLGLHVRASSKLVDLATKYISHMTIECKGKKANAKRILEVMTLGAKEGDYLALAIEGKDEQQAMKAITALLHEKFGEKE